MSSKGKGKRLNPFQHALKRPDTYIGSAKTVSTNVYLFDDSLGTAVLKKCQYNPGLFNIVREILSNAIDNVWRSNEKGTPMKRIDISIDTSDGSITVWNDGYCIPVHVEEYEYTDPRSGKTFVDKLYPAEVFFGDMFAGTNYDDDEVRKTSGRNGMGAKATNVFSKEFVVECTCPDDKKKFYQVYRKNGRERDPPKITSCRNKTGYTSISFTPDYKYFSYPSDEEPGIDENFTSLLKLYAYEVSMITGILVKFSVDGEKKNIRVNSLEKFVRLFHPDTERKLVSFKSPNGDDCVLVETDEPELDATEDISQISFVNGIRTKSGGLHVETWKDAVIPAIVRGFNSKRPKRGEKSLLKTSAKEIYPYLQLFIRVEVDRPRFASQTKDELTEIFNEKNKSIPYRLFNARKKTEKEEWMRHLDLAVKKILKWNFIVLLEEKLLAKFDRALARKEGSSKKRINMGSKADDANFAGGKRSMECTLWLAEGLSAKTFAVSGFSHMTGGRDLNGVFALKGKPLNTQKASARMMNNNEEINMLKKILGLRHGIDYSIDKNFKTLRYGKVNICADADDDGIHIRGLVLSFFYKWYPALLSRQCIHSLSTAVATAIFSGRKNKLLFYSNPEFKRWYDSSETEKMKRLQIKYIKGLGTINPRDVPGYFKDPKLITYVMEGDEEEYMDLGFGETKNYADARKEWITRDMTPSLDMNPEEVESEEEEDFAYQGELGLSTFVDQQLIIYHRETFRRSLPSIWDGLKESQRKILFGLINQNYKSTVGLVEACGAIKKDSAYHHGESSLYGTTIKMVQGFVGSNNIPLLQRDGQFGSRLEGGKDAAAPRYISTGLEKIARIIFSANDDPLLERMISDNKPVEYKFFMPIIPMILVNGVYGISTGYSSTVPCYNPLDLVKWIETWLDDEDAVDDLEELVPWYRGFTGKIKLVKKGGKAISWISEGKMEKGTGKDKGWWNITELPIGLWSSDFKAWLEYLESGAVPKDKKWKKLNVKCLSDIRDYTTANTVHFQIKPTRDFIPDIDTNGNMSSLRQKKSLMNMIAIDENNYPHRFESPEDILKVFCPKRLSYYNLRKKYILKVLKKDLLKASNRYRFVKGVVDKKLDLYQTDEDLEKTLSSEKWHFRKIPSEKKDPSYDYLLSMQMRSMTVKKLAELRNEKEKLKTSISETKGKSIQNMWREELAEFRKAYKVFLRTRYEE